MCLTNHFPVDRQIVSSLEAASRYYRLDPSQYNKKGEKLLRHLRQLGRPLLPISRLDGFKKVFLPNRFIRIYLDDHSAGIPMLGTSSMFMTVLPINSTVMKNSIRYFDKLWIKPGDILISRSGTVGTSVLCGNSYSKHIASDDCFRLRLAEKWQGYVTTYLQSVFGRTLITRDAHGKVIKHLKDYDIKNLLIPIMEEQEIREVNDYMLRAQALVDNTRALLKEADLKLCQILAFDPFAAATSTMINIESEAFLKASSGLFNCRLDPHFHTPAALHIRNVLFSKPHELLGDIADVWMVTRFARPKADPGYGVSFYSSGDIMRARRLPSSTVALKAKRYLDKCRVKTNTILLCRSGAYGGIMGRASFVTAAMKGWAISEHMVRVEPRDGGYLPEYLYAFLASATFGYPLITSFRHGKDVPEIDPKELKFIPVPKLSKKDRDEIGIIVRDAFNALDEANEYEKKAHDRLVEVLGWHTDDRVSEG